MIGIYGTIIISELKGIIANTSTKVNPYDKMLAIIKEK